MSQQGAVPVSPQAVRLRRPGWRDPRLLVGLVMVAASVALGSWLVSAAGRTVPVYAAGQPLVAGEAIERTALVVEQVQVGAQDGIYLRADEPLPVGLVAVRTVGRGELVPAAAVAVDADLAVRSVAITPAGTLSSAVVEASSVDLWFVPAAPASTAAQAPAPPVQLAAALTVAEVSEPSGGFAVGGVTVHVLVPVDELPAVLEALAADGSVELVPVPGGTTSR